MKFHHVKMFFHGTLNTLLPDGIRCDCVTETHAIEFDFGGT